MFGHSCRRLVNGKIQARIAIVVPMAIEAVRFKERGDAFVPCLVIDLGGFRSLHGVGGTHTTGGRTAADKDIPDAR